MNYEINNYETKQDLFEIDKRYYENNIVDYEREYEIQNNSRQYYNIESFLSPGCGPRELNYNPNCQKSLNAMSEQKKNNKIDLNNYIYSENLNKFDNNNYINGNNNITLLSLTDKIYEDEDHFNKGIIRKRNSKFENNCSKKEKSSSKFGGNNNKRSNRKSLFISNSKVFNRELIKRIFQSKEKEPVL